MTQDLLSTRRNVEEIGLDLDQAISSCPPQPFARNGSGEFTDGLAIQLRQPFVEVSERLNPDWEVIRKEVIGCQAVKGLDHPDGAGRWDSLEEGKRVLMVDREKSVVSYQDVGSTLVSIQVVNQDVEGMNVACDGARAPSHVARALQLYHAGHESAAEVGSD